MFAVLPVCFLCLHCWFFEVVPCVFGLSCCCVLWRRRLVGGGDIGSMVALVLIVFPSLASCVVIVVVVVVPVFRVCSGLRQCSSCSRHYSWLRKVSVSVRVLVTLVVVIIVDN